MMPRMLLQPILETRSAWRALLDSGGEIFVNARVEGNSSVIMWEDNGRAERYDACRPETVNP
jgi:hypothetical protein